MAVLVGAGAGCGATATSLLVDLELDEARYAIAHLSLTLIVGGRTVRDRTAIDSPDGHPVRNGDTIAILLPDDFDGLDATVQVESVNPAPSLRGEGGGRVRKGQQVAIQVRLLPPQEPVDMGGDLDGQPQMPPPDLAGGDGGAAADDLAGGDPPGDGSGGSDTDLSPPAPDLARADLTPCNPQSCPLGCNAMLERCKRPLPTNLAAAPLELLFQRDVVIAADTTLDTANGTARQGGNVVTPGFVFSIDPGTQPVGAPRLAMFAARSLVVNAGATLRFVDSSGANPGNAPLLLTAGDLVVNGRIEAGAQTVGGLGLPGAGRLPGPGGYFGSNSSAAGGGPAGCGGASGTSGAQLNNGGGGGGAAAAAGGHGAATPNGTGGGGGGTTLVAAPSPLVGGCGGGSGPLNNNVHADGGGGGGALQLSAGQRLRVGATGRIDAAGNGGLGGADTGAGGGGGGGGSIVLEGVTVEVAPGALITCNGGAGGAGGNGRNAGGGTAGQPGPNAVAAATGGASNSPGGGGGWDVSPAGGNAPGAGSTEGGGGGGAAGHVASIATAAQVPVGTRSGVYRALPVTRSY